MKSSILTLFIFITAVINLNAQDSEKDSHIVTIGVPEVALLDLESTQEKSLNFNLTAPTEAGNPVNTTKFDYNIWLNYSSIIESSSTRKVDVQITNGKIPDGLMLRIYAWGDNGNGKGALGKSNYLVELKETQPTTIINSIGSAYTGNGPNKGHRILYYLTRSSENDFYSKLDSDQSNTLTITYTLSDD